MKDSQSAKPKRRATLRSVAELAGVSTATVSYVLSGRRGGRPGISPATIGKVRAAADDLDYQPNQAARAIRTGKSNLVVLSLKMLSDPWTQSLSAAVSSAVRPDGMTAFILADGDWPTALTRQQCDVAFIDDIAGPDEHEALDRLARRGVRLVVFDDQLEPSGFDVIRSDAGPGCRLAVRHLLAAHQRIGCLAYSDQSSTKQQERLLVYLEEMAEAGVQVRPGDVQRFERSPASADAAATRLLSRKDRPTAIYAVTDYAAISAIHAAHRLHLKVPDDVAIIGVGNTTDANLTRPTLSTVGPEDFFSSVATILHDAAVGNRDVGQLHDFTWSLIARESTATR